tara:strand:+ start:1391 stop:3484 length:2094 start_codon:yes stop_codon:yes gene_type:complete
MINKFKLLNPTLSILFGITLTLLFVGPSNIGFENTNWFNSYDLKSDLLAFKFFFNDTWRFPLGLNPNYGELSNSIVFSGAVPVLSIVFKFLKFLLPDNFHYFTLWIFICFSLQYYFSYKIIYYLTKNNFYSVVSSIFFLLSPILIYRLNLHLSLSAHWLILAIIYLDLNQNQNNILLKKIFLIVISSLIHFYFTIMLIFMNIFFSFFNNKTKFSKNFFRENLLIFLFLIISMYLVGYFHIPATDALGFGFGYYKTNFLSLLDPSYSINDISWSILIPDIYNSTGEKEGFAYLGLGVLCMLIHLITNNFKNPKKLRINYKYFTLCSFLFLLAISNNISLGSFELINLNLPNILYAPLSVIRASGRLIWPVYYIIIIFIIYRFYIIKKKNYLFFITLFLIIQFFDFSKPLHENFIKEKKIYNNNLNDPIWEFVSKNFSNISSTNISNRSKSFGLISEFLINNNFNSTNYFRLGRYNREAASKYRSKFIENVMNKKINKNNAYIVENLDQLRHLKILLKDTEHGIFFRDGLWILLPNQKKMMLKKDISQLNLVKLHSLKEKNIRLSQNDENGILGLGWSHPSYGRTLGNSGVWSEGYYSSLIFESADYGLDSVKVILRKVLTNKKKENLKIRIFINGLKYRDINLNSKNEEINIDNIKEYIVKGSNIITFNILNPLTPKSRLESIDGRLLGILVEKVIFE